MKYKKEELEQLIKVEKLSYEEIGRRYSVSGTYIKKIASKLGVILDRRSKFPENFVPYNKGTRKINYCIVCGQELDVFSRKYCSCQCMGKDRINKSFEKYKDDIKNNSNVGNDKTIKKIKKFILEEQDNKCAICGIENTWNNKNLTLILDHIDGKSNNNKRDNFRCVCPNCDSQLDTYKSKNRNSDRKNRYLKSIKYIDKI